MKHCLIVATFSLLFSIAMPSVAADLTIYTYDSFISDWGPGPALEQAFEKQCECNIEYIAVEDGIGILNRARIEGENTKADILLGLDDGLIEETRKLGLVKNHDLELPEFRAELDWQENSFVPFDFGYFAFVYDKNKIVEPVSSFDELLASNASIIYQDPRTSTPGQGLMHWVNVVYDGHTAEFWKALSKQTVTVTKGWWEAYSLFLNGDTDYVLSYSTSPAYHKVAEDKHNYEAALFSDGHVAQIEVAAISAYTKNDTLARTFLNFLVSPTAQNIIPTTNWMEPVIDGVTLPSAFDETIKPKRIGVSAKQFANNRKAWIKDWLTAVTQ